MLEVEVAPVLWPPAPTEQVTGVPLTSSSDFAGHSCMLTPSGRAGPSGSAAAADSWSNGDDGVAAAGGGDVGGADWQ